MTRKTLGRALAGLTLCGLMPAASGDIVVRLRFEHDQVLQFEPVHAFVLIQNESLYPLVIDHEQPDAESDFDLVVRTGDYTQAARRQKGHLVPKLLLKPGERREIALEVSEWYDLAHIGRYTVQAVLKEGPELQWGSAAVGLEVIPGIEIASLRRHLPGYGDVARRYSLRYWTRERRESLFLRVDEESTGYNCGVFALGRLIRVFKPQIEADKEGVVTVLHQSGRDRYTRSVFRSLPDGVEFVDQRYLRSDGSPYEAPAAPESEPPGPDRR